MQAKELMKRLADLDNKADNPVKASFWGIGSSYNVSNCELSLYGTKIHLTLSKDECISGKQILLKLQDIAAQNSDEILENTVYLIRRVYCSTVIATVKYNPLDGNIYLMVKMENET